MQRIIPALFALTLASPAAALETRCGWLDNPTPANWWMEDAHGVWVLSAQGQPVTHDFFDLDWGGVQEWVSFNGSYGYGCACMEADVDKATRAVTRVTSFTWIPLARCEQDPALPNRG